MPYLIRTPAEYGPDPDGTAYLDTRFSLPSFLCLSSTSTIDLALTRDFKAWGWKVGHFDATNPDRNVLAFLKLWRRLDRKHNFKKKTFDVWAKEHGKRIAAKHEETAKEKTWRQRIKSAFSSISSLEDAKRDALCSGKPIVTHSNGKKAYVNGVRERVEDLVEYRPATSTVSLSSLTERLENMSLDRQRIA